MEGTTSSEYTFEEHGTKHPLLCKRSSKDWFPPEMAELRQWVCTWIIAGQVDSFLVLNVQEMEGAQQVTARNAQMTPEWLHFPIQTVY